MEYVSGGTLRERLGWPQDLDYAISIVSQIGDALADAHRQGMIHRDVKPGNVLMVEEDWPLLSDFGLAKMVQDTLHLTMSGASVGTPQYMSPEQAQSHPVDQRSDVYSLGVVLYEAVAGQPPFGFESPMAVILKHISDPVTPPHHFRSDLPDELERVILKALTKDPAGRYQRMEDFLTDLHGATDAKSSRRMGVKPIETPPVLESISPPPITRRRSVRRKSPWLIATIRILLLVALTLTLLLYRDRIMPLASDLTNLIVLMATGPMATATSTPVTVAAGPSITISAPPTAVSDSSNATPDSANTPDPVAAEFDPSPTASVPTSTLEPTATPTIAPLVIETQVWPTDGAEMVFIAAGEFSMGSEELGDDERPVHQVYLDDFWLDRYEVTNERFARFVADTNYQTDAEKAGWGWVRVNSEWEEVSNADWRHPRGPDSSIEGKMDHPVVLVSWDDADAYCRWAGKQLPTEAQWEKAARGPGSNLGHNYAWGDTFDASRANTKEAGLNDTTPVGSYSPLGDSPYGAADMTGNVWEWVSDWYGSNYYNQSLPTNPFGPAGGTYKVLRGGSWLFDEVYARTAFRYNVSPDYTYDFTGFRCSLQ
jgi:formylglycine-generating enzyme required for sulfatase activity